MALAWFDVGAALCRGSETRAARHRGIKPLLHQEVTTTECGRCDLVKRPEIFFKPHQNKRHVT